MTAAIDPRPRARPHLGSGRGLLGLGLVALVASACGPGSPPPAKLAPTPIRESEDPGARDNSLTSSKAPAKPEFAPPDLELLRFACEGFDRAVAAGAPPDRLLSHAAARAVELGGAPVEAATRRWALLPPQALLEEVQRYAASSQAGPDACAGLRAHLERMAMQSASH
ncbi:hypothetical protein DB30_07832 [Enhygromyxa salina]|uniref:Uncharacterized protein n=1 Tax=Enhygromyxa salina TaxID=215803 RepID=A0A0C1Z7K7_9BACT|nr:hypothetical protein [Enhygromyxa salina]KIG13624.1 hypothetical protein DB30_07832 [Enhygromyxa salina]